MLAALADQAQRLKPAIDRVQPQEWVSKGASPAYTSQRQSAATQVSYFVRLTQQLAQAPDKLTIALDTLFRMQSMELTLHSLAEGVRKYQDQELATTLLNLLNENAANQEKLRQHIVELAANNEAELRIIDQEAQRCRGGLLRPAPRPTRTVPRRIERKPEGE